jgi:hypothetical protein
VDSEQALRDPRAQLRHQVRAWQKAADRDDQEPGGLEVAIAELNRALAEMPPRMERLKKSGLKKLSQTASDAPFMRQGGRSFVLGYSADISVSDNHLVVAQRVTRNTADNGSLEPMVDQVKQRRGAPLAVLADGGCFSIDNLKATEQRNIDAYVPDSNMAGSLNLGLRCRTRACARAHRRMRAKLQSPGGQAAYPRRKAVVEPVFGVLKQQRALRQFHTRGLDRVANESPWPLWPSTSRGCTACAA